MLLERRKLVMHPQKTEAEGEVEFHQVEGRVEARFFDEWGKVDTSADNCHAVLIFYRKDANLSLYLSQQRVRNGVVSFPYLASFEAWKEPVADGLIRIQTLEDSDLRKFREYPTCFPPQVAWLAKAEWSGQAVFKE